MSLQLLKRVSAHLENAGLLVGYKIRYFDWSDKDLSGAADFVLFRMAGAGPRDSVIQRPSVMIVLVCGPQSIEQGNDASKAIFDKLADGTATAGVLKFEPLGIVGGPYRLNNDRRAFDMTVRCFVEDY